MEEFYTNNNILMVRGELLSWQKIPVYEGQDLPFVLGVFISGVVSADDSYNFNYVIEDQILYFNGMRFYCETLYHAEKMIIAFCIGMNIKLPMIYDNGHRPLAIMNDREVYLDDVSDFMKK